MSEGKKTEKIDARQSNRKPGGFPDSAIIRLLDASLNRASEGLRVVESFSRMVLEDVFLSNELKQLRHRLMQSSKCISAQSRMQCRDSEGDPGRNVRTESEYRREDFESLIRANMARVQQATREIEEFSKSEFPSLALEAEQIRYSAYTIEKAIFNVTFNRVRFENSHLYVLVDACGERTGFEKLAMLVTTLVDANVDLIQLRDKSLNDRELVEAGKLVGSLTKNTNTLWAMNDRVDLCVAAGADGVHLGQTDLSVHQARMMLRPNQFVGVSTHSIEQARQAVIDGADYIGVGPVFPSQTKSFDSHVGVELVSEVVSEFSLPVFAIGGIEIENVANVVAAGCRRIAVSNAVTGSAQPRSTAVDLRTQLVEVV